MDFCNAERVSTFEDKATNLNQDIYMSTLLNQVPVARLSMSSVNSSGGVRACYLSAKARCMSVSFAHCFESPWNDAFNNHPNLQEKGIYTNFGIICNLLDSFMYLEFCMNL